MAMRQLMALPGMTLFKVPISILLKGGKELFYISKHISAK